MSLQFGELLLVPVGVIFIPKRGAESDQCWSALLKETLYGCINWRWTPPCPSWWWLVANFLDLLLHPKESISTQRKSAPFSRCNLQEISKSVEDCRDVWLYPKIHIKSFKMLPTLHQTGKEWSLICMGRCLPISVWGNQAIPHASVCSCSSSIRETLPFVC